VAHHLALLPRETEISPTEFPLVRSLSLTIHKRKILGQ
jgi:hypothetical protein